MGSPKPQKDYYTTREVADLLNVHQATVIFWIRTGKIQAVRVVERGRYLIPNDVVKALLARLGKDGDDGHDIVP